jgi:hypothetical protein
MTDAVLGICCTLVGAVLAIVGVAVLAFGCYTLAIGHGGGWWIVELFYVLLGAGLAFVGLYSSRYGLGLLREKKNPMVRDGPAT